MDKKFHYINLSYLEDLCDGNSEFKKELINIFLAQVPEFISNMKKYLESGDNDSLAKEAHTAKSSALIFSMEETGNVLKQIQLLAKDVNTGPLASLINKVEAHLLQASEELSNYLDQIS